MGQQFDEIVAREARGFLPVVKRLPVAIAEGRGSRVRDVEGRELVDLTAGWGVCAIGHCHPRLVAAISEQAGRLMQTTNLFYTLPQLDLIDRLRDIAPAELTRSFFVSSGAEAMDGALKLAHRATGRTKFVSTTQSFHGRTLGALAIIGQEKHRSPYQRIIQEGCYVPFGDLAAARAAIDDNTAAFVVEPVQGEGGVNVAKPGYLAGLRELTREAGALLVLDEIQTGIGRTGKWLALEWDAVVPDVVTLGKGLGGGFPIAAFLCTEDVATTVSLGDHGGTYAGNPLACAAANAVLSVIEEDGLVARTAELGERVQERLRRFVAEHPKAAARVRGRGLLIGMELLDVDAAATLSRRAIERGVLVNVTAGNVLRLFPALNIPEEELWPALDTVLELARVNPAALTDVAYEVERGLAWITIDRPERYNAFRAHTVDELIACFKAAWADKSVGVVCLTGAGDKAFCAGGDQKQREETGDYGPSESGLFEIETLHRVIRDIPKPVIAAVNGIAIGGGHVLHVLCDLTIAAEHARFGQAGPRVGSFDAGFGSAYLARILGDKRAREIWYLCRQYDAATMLQWGLVNAVVPGSELRAEVRKWADEILEKSPTALRFLKHSFNADSESIAGIGTLSFAGLDLFVNTDEAREGVEAFAAKRKPDFSKHRK